MKKIIVSISLVAVVVIFVLIFSYEERIFNYEQQISKYEERIEVAGAIRSAGNQGWYAVSDDAHVPLNISRIEVENGAIFVYFTFSASQTHTFIVTPDEVYSEAGMFVGASVARDQAAIYLSMLIDGKVVRIDPSEIESEWGNLWIYGLFTK